MIRTSLLLGVLLAGAAVPAAAQNSIRPGQTVQGELASDDPLLDDDTHFDVWRFQGQAGHTYQVTLRSDDFDAYLAVGSDGGGCDGCATDDDGAGGTDSRAEFRAPSDGTFEIRANSLSAGETGDYTLELEDLGEGEDEGEGEGGEPDASDVAAIPLESGPAVNGELTESDAQAEDESFYDLYVYRGRAGEAVTISLSSEAFDAFLTVGQLVNGAFQVLDANDDGPAGTDSFLRMTLPEDGEYLVRANTLGAGETGAYTIRLTRG
ncbi:MAG TPA: pre-peptidase C-terminal domain-containing protein [Longimicrobium sp.]|nr:pre-peptidase C-terminal domain-containing protein [Longimicrobium sp.]